MTPARILVVEDDHVVARDIQHQLTRIGYRVIGCTSLGEEAVRLALESHPDLVLMDIRLEGGSRWCRRGPADPQPLSGPRGLSDGLCR